jgi:hypothetical protein
LAETQEALGGIKVDRDKRERARQRLAGVLKGIDVRLADGRVWCTVRFTAGQVRGVWFDANHHGLFSASGRFTLQEMEAVLAPDGF